MRSWSSRVGSASNASASPPESAYVSVTAILLRKRLGEREIETLAQNMDYEIASAMKRVCSLFGKLPEFVDRTENVLLGGISHGPK